MHLFKRAFRTKTNSRFLKYQPSRGFTAGTGTVVLGAGLFSWWSSEPKVAHKDPNLFPKAHKPPLIEEEANLTFAPEVPPPIHRNHSVKLKVDMDVEVKKLLIDGVHDYEFWTFNGGMPGPFIRAREGDVMEVSLTNGDMSGMLHNIDFHAVAGPGGGAVLLTADSGETKQAYFRLDDPGLFIYHCAVAPVPHHIANGMYGLMLVEPKEGLPKVDKEYYVLQSELYCTEDSEPGTNTLSLDEDRLMDENPNYVVFNGADGALRDAGALKAKTGERVRIFFGNAGPNLISSFHVIGALFDKVYREGDFINPPARLIQTTLVPSGGAAMVELELPIPGTFALVDHSVSRFEKGAIGWLEVEGEPRPDVFHSVEPPRVCPRCKHHP